MEDGEFKSRFFRNDRPLTDREFLHAQRLQEEEFAKSPTNIKMVKKSILECTEQYLMHQIDCIGREPMGLSKQIFAKYPYANIYDIRKGDISEQGTIDIRGNGSDQRYIINYFGQYYPSKPNSTTDTLELRLDWLNKGLKLTEKIANIESVAIPFKMGCGLGGGTWYSYLARICQLAWRNPGIKIVLYRFLPH